LAESAELVFGKGKKTSRACEGEVKTLHAKIPGGHLKIPHLWPGQNPPVEGIGFSVFTL
jgi:hypothetical protein